MYQILIAIWHVFTVLVLIQNRQIEERVSSTQQQQVDLNWANLSETQRREIWIQKIEPLKLFH